MRARIGVRVAAVEVVGEDLEAIAVEPLEELDDHPRHRMIVKRRGDEAETQAPRAASAAMNGAAAQVAGHAKLLAAASCSAGSSQ